MTSSNRKPSYVCSKQAKHSKNLEYDLIRIYRTYLFSRYLSSNLNLVSLLAPIIFLAGRPSNLSKLGLAMKRLVSICQSSILGNTLSSHKW